MKQYVERCDQCQRMKNRAEMPAGKLRPNEILVSKGYDSILIVCNRFLKMLHFMAMTEKIIAEGLARLFRDNV